MANIFSTGLSALTAFQRSLATTSHNIANVDTDGYSRQQTDLATRFPENTGYGYIGTGVQAVAVTREYDAFLSNQVRERTSANQEYSTYFERASQVDNLISADDTGVNLVMQDFFNAMQDVANDPSSIPTRQVMISASESLVDRFHALNTWFEDQRSQFNEDLQSIVNEVNQLGEALARANQAIGESVGWGTGQQPNDLLDTRDALLNEISELVSITAVEQSDGQVNVFVGNGQTLVLGTQSNTLSTQVNPGEADRLELFLASGSALVPVTDAVSGGELGGFVRYREEVLDPAQNALGQLAMGVGIYFNQQHSLGMDLDGVMGLDYFTVASPEILGDPSNTGTATLAISDISATTGTDYELSTSNGTDWTLLRRDTGAVAATASLAGGGTISVDGLTITIAAGAAAGDSYVLRPTRQGAAVMDMSITSVREIAAAGPIAVASGAANTGSGVISNEGLSTRTGATLPAAPITLTFDNVLNQFNVSTGGTIAYDPATDSGNTLTLTIAGLGDFSFEMSGVPANGDTFVFSDNTGAVGDNRNARALSDLQSVKLMSSGSATFSDSYSRLVADVGSKTHQASVNADTQQRLLDQAVDQRDAVSGVNLDEEAANLVHFQQAYQASARVISIARTMFDSLLNAV